MLTDVFKVIVNNLFKESSYRKKKKKKLGFKNTHNRLSILPYISLKYFFLSIFFIIFPNHFSL